MIKLQTPIRDEEIKNLNVGDMVEISGEVYCGRDAVLPKICKLIEDEKLEEYGIKLKGSVIFHTAVSVAGIGPTSSNKLEILDSFLLLSKAGVKIHLGKGTIPPVAIGTLAENNAAFAIVPPVTALLRENIIEQECVAFPELGMEALYRLKVDRFPAIIAAAQGRSIYDE